MIAMTTLTRGGTTITPDLVLGWESSREARTVAHPVLDRPGVDNVTLRNAAPRTGTMRLFFASLLDAQAAEAAHATAGVWLLDSTQPPTAVRTNRAVHPRPSLNATGWGFQNGTGEVTTLTTTTTDPGPEGRTGFVRRTVTTAKTGGNSGWYYRETAPSLGGVAGDVRTMSTWVRVSHPTYLRMNIGLRLGSTTVTGSASPYVLIPANTWTRLSHTATATGAFDNTQGWVNTDTAPVPVDGWYDATDLLCEDGATLGAYFDGSTPATVGAERVVTRAWDGPANASASTETTRPTPAVPGGTLRYVVDGPLALRSATDDGAQWILEVGYREVAA